jgi:alpha-mannosidase
MKNLPRVALMSAAIFCAFSFNASAQNNADAKASKHIYLANDDHTDYMWSADADTYNKVFVDLLDFHLDLAEKTKDKPSQFRSKFNVDGNYWLWQYERQKSKADFEKLIARIKDGTISAPLNTLVSTYGAQPVEAVLRGMYYSGRLERRYDMRFKMANATENQTLPLGLASLFAGSGADYTWRGVCGCASHIPNKVLFERPNEVYWYTGHDGQKQLMKWYSLGPHNLGTYWEAGFPEKAINWTETNEGFKRRHVDPKTNQPYDIVGLFGYGGDDLARKTGLTPPPPIPAVPRLQAVPSSPFSDHFHVIAEKMSNDKRQVIVSNSLDYFAEFSKKYGATLPSQSVTYGNEWDLYSASMSETSARAKRAVEKLRTAELLATITSLKYPAFMSNHIGARDDAFTDLGLYWEHDWTADGPVTRGQRAAWQEKLVANIEYYVNSIYAEGLIRIGGMIPLPAKAHRFFVVNPLGWARTEFSDHPYSGKGENIRVRDLTTGKDVPHQLVKINGASFLRILAPDVPATGYKVFEVQQGASTAPTDLAARVSDDGANKNSVIENAAVKLVVAPDGAVRSFIDKRRGNKELAATIDGLQINDFAANSDAGDALRVENAGPVSVTLRARSDAGLPHSTTITLYRDSDRVDIKNEINSNFGDTRHWAFSFNLDAPSLRTEEVGGINLNKLKSEGGHYADSHARYDYLTLNHFADFTSGDGKSGVTISNPDLAFAKLGRSNIKKLDSKTPQLNVLAGGQVDGRWLGIQDQNGASYFLQRFALRGHAGYDQVGAMKFALEHQNPLIAGDMFGKPEGKLPEKTYSLMTVSDPNVLLWAVKPADDGIDKGIVARLWNLSNAPAKANLKLSTGTDSAQRTTHIETDLESVTIAKDGSIPTSYAPQQLQTYRLKPTAQADVTTTVSGAVPATPAK